MLITTKDNVKSLLKITSTDEDVILNAVVLGVSAEFENYMDRKIESTARTEYYDIQPGQKIFSVPGYPISAVAGIWNDTERDFGSSTLIDSTSYTFLGTQGQIIIDDYTLMDGAKALKITYTGGMAATQAALQTAYPDLEFAARVQSCFAFKKKDRIGISAESVAGASISVDQKYELLPGVIAVLDKYKRYE